VEARRNSAGHVPKHTKLTRSNTIPMSFSMLVPFIFASSIIKARRTNKRQGRRMLRRKKPESCSKASYSLIMACPSSSALQCMDIIIKILKINITFWLGIYLSRLRTIRTEVQYCSTCTVHVKRLENSLKRTTFRNLLGTSTVDNDLGQGSTLRLRTLTN
jgi:hypothetical protein